MNVQKPNTWTHLQSDPLIFKSSKRIKNFFVSLQSIAANFRIRAASPYQPPDSEKKRTALGFFWLLFRSQTTLTPRRTALPHARTHVNVQTRKHTHTWCDCRQIKGNCARGAPRPKTCFDDCYWIASFVRSSSRYCFTADEGKISTMLTVKPRTVLCTLPAKCK